MSQTPPPPPPPPGPYGGPPPPQGPPGGPQPGSLLDRFLARLIDGVGFAIIFVLLGVVFGAIFYSGFSNSFGERLLYSLFLQVFAVVIYLGYYGWFESNQGATFGKQLMKLKVVAPHGEGNPTLQQALMRNGWYALGLIGIIPFLGIIASLAQLAIVIVIAVTINGDPVRRQGIHDKFAGGTQVLKVG
jgi:uncharacterized RDD family membrane protein YckC